MKERKNINLYYVWNIDCTHCAKNTISIRVLQNFTFISEQILDIYRLQILFFVKDYVYVCCIECNNRAATLIDDKLNN